MASAVIVVERLPVYGSSETVLPQRRSAPAEGPVLPKLSLAAT